MRAVRSIVGAKRTDEQVMVEWSDGSTSGFHHLWLRDNCPCPACRFDDVPERTLDTLTVPDDVSPSSVDADVAVLGVVWDDGHRSRFDAGWLGEYAYDGSSDHGGSRSGTASGDVEIRLWTDGPPDPLPAIDYDQVVAGEAGVLRWLELIERHGVCFVRNAPLQSGTVVDLAERIAFLRNSNFGLVWDVVSKPNPDSLAYTPKRLTPHTDLVARQMLPGIQFLHCMVFDAEGGDTTLVDGFAAAEALRAEDPDAFRLLTVTPLTFRYRDRVTTDITFRVPLIQLDDRGAVREVRYSNALLAPIDVAPDQMAATYRAVRAFGRLLHGTRFLAQTRLVPGDVMCMDNYRLLHGREAFDPNSGPRQLQGCYVDRDDFLSRLRMLRAAPAVG